jgi:hypothetical protein
VENNRNRLWIVSCYNQDPTELVSKLKSPYMIFNQGDISRIPSSMKNEFSFTSTLHTGHNLSDYLHYIINNYNNLPDSLGFAKGNLWPRHISVDIFLKRQDLEGFVPLYSDETTVLPINHRFWRFKLIAQQTSPGYFSEITNNWYVAKRKPGLFYPKLHDFFEEFLGRKPPNYITFVPGGCMIVPASKIKAWPLDVYKRLYEAVSYDFFPVEAFHLERSMLYFFDFPRC